MIEISDDKIFFELFEEFEKRQVHIFYKGPLKPHVLSSTAEYIEYVLEKKPQEAQKIRKIFIELAQNISFYSEEKYTTKGKTFGIGVIVLEEKQGEYVLYAGNKTLTDDVIPVLRKCTIINDLDRESLREFKREQRQLASEATKGGNIGLITAALTSDNPINFDLYYIDEEYSFLILWLNIKKEQK